MVFDAAVGVSCAEEEVKPKQRNRNAPQKVAEWLSALGGANNISTVEACAQTRLRVMIKNRSAIDEGLPVGTFHLKSSGLVGQWRQGRCSKVRLGGPVSCGFRLPAGWVHG